MSHNVTTLECLSVRGCDSSSAVPGARRALFVLVLCIGASLMWILPHPVYAEIYYPLSDQRIPSDFGTYYVVMRREGGDRFPTPYGPVRCEYVAANGKCLSPDIERSEIRDDVVTDDRFVVVRNPDVSVRPHDRIISEMLINDPPSDVLVSSCGRGFVLVGRYGSNFFHDSTDVEGLQIFGTNGTKVRHFTLSQLVGPYRYNQMVERRGTHNRLVWFRTGWFDECNGVLVIVCSDNSVVKVDLNDWSVESGNSSDIAGGLRQRSCSRVSAALEVVYELGAKEHLPLIRHFAMIGVGDSDTFSRASLLLCKFGDPSGQRLLQNAFKKPSASTEDRSYVTLRLKEAMGGDALSVLPDLLLDRSQRSSMMNLIDQLGISEVVAFERCLTNDSKAVRLEAIGLLKSCGPVALDSLMRVALDPDDEVRSAAKRAIQELSKVPDGEAK